MHAEACAKCCHNVTFNLGSDFCKDLSFRFAYQVSNWLFDHFIICFCLQYQYLVLKFVTSYVIITNFRFSCCASNSHKCPGFSLSYRNTHACHFLKMVLLNWQLNWRWENFFLEKIPRKCFYFDRGQFSARVLIWVRDILVVGVFYWGWLLVTYF